MESNSSAFEKFLGSIQKRLWMSCPGEFMWGWTACFLKPLAKVISDFSYTISDLNQIIFREKKNTKKVAFPKKHNQFQTPIPESAQNLIRFLDSNG